MLSTDMVTRLSDAAAADPELAAELADLSADERRWLAADLALRERARRIAQAIGHDESDVYHQLKQLARDPIERLRRGLAHGRRRVPEPG
jgi:hypothetical protein